MQFMRLEGIDEADKYPVNCRDINDSSIAIFSKV